MKKVFGVLLVCSVLHAAAAQEDDVDTGGGGGGGGGLDASLDFTVTAGRVREAASKVSGQITVITADDIAKSGASSVVDVLETVPGVRLSRDRQGASIDISVRGVASDYGKSKVLVIVDGMRLNPTQSAGIINWGMINLSEVERIEVLDGGASVQYGDNAQAGVINIITKKSGAAKTDITVSAGSFFQNEQRFSHHRPAGWGSLSISGGHTGTQGFQKHTANDSGNGELRASFDINDAMNLQVNVGFVFGNSLASFGLTKEQFDDDPTQNPGPVNTTLSNTGINAGIGFTWAINDVLTLNVPVSYNFASLKGVYSYTGPMAGYNAVYDYITPLALGIRPQINAELKPAGMGLRLIGGVDAFLASGGFTTSPDLERESNPAKQMAYEYTAGPWASVNFEPLTFLSVNAGLRYDTAFIDAHIDKWSGSVFVPSAGPMPMSWDDQNDSTQWGAFVYEAGLTVNPLDFLKVYAKYGTQFRYPYLDHVVMNTAYGGAALLNIDIKPEKGWTAEGGIGLSVKKIAKLDANFYYMRVDNEIAEVPTPTGSWAVVNLDPIDRIGTNASLTVTPFKDYIALNIDYGFVQAVFTEGVYKDKVVPLTAAHTLSGSFMLRFPFGLSLGPDVLYKSEMHPGADYGNIDPIVDPSMIWGASIRYEPQKFEGNLAFQVVAHNLADVKYASIVYSQGYGYFPDSSMGRSLKVLVQYQF